MKFTEYQIKARRTQNPELTQHERLCHALFGLCSEVGEVQAIYQKSYQGHRVKTEKVIDELGDVLWFVAELCDALGVNMDGVARYNIDKLEKRYPDGFSAERSVNRSET